MGNLLTCQRTATLRSQTLVAQREVAELMQDRTNGYRVCEDFARMPPRPLSIHGRELSRVPEHVPVRKRDCSLGVLLTYVLSQQTNILTVIGAANVPGSSNSRILLPLLRSCSSSFASRSRPQYFWCSISASQCSSEQCVGHPQSGHSYSTFFGCACVCGCTPCWCSLAHTGQGASCLIASPRARMAGKGDCENGWKRLSSVRMGSFCSFPFELEVCTGLLLNQLRNVRALVCG